MCKHERWEVMTEEYQIAVCKECGVLFANPLAPMQPLDEEILPDEEIDIF